MENKKTKLILFFFNKMAPKTLDGSAFSFTSLKGHTTHISILWVFVLFTFIAVAVVSLGGLQEGLVERQFPDTKVNGDLDVTEGILSKTGLISTNDLPETDNTDNFTAENNRFYTISGSGFTITLPTPEIGNTIKFLVTANLTGNVDITSPTPLALGSLLNKQGTTTAGAPNADAGLAGVVANGTTDVTLTLSAGGGGGGVGTNVECYGVRQGTNTRWLIKALSALSAAAVDASDFQ